jgi:hypothetical protein
MARLEIEHKGLTFLISLLSREIDNIHERLNGDKSILLTLDEEFSIIAEENTCKRLLASCMAEDNKCRRLLASCQNDD